MPKKATVDGYEIEVSSDNHTTVKYGKFSGTLAQFEDTGQLTSISGRTHFTPPWVVYKLANAARALAEA